MLKDNSFRICVALLLSIQTLCWALTLLDLISPGKPLSLLRSSSDFLSHLPRLFYRSAILSYKDVRVRV